jgi:hypothetical protein
MRNAWQRSSLGLMGEHRPTGSPPSQTCALSLKGEVVEIFEEGGQRLAKIVLEARSVLEVAVTNPQDVHLGDRVVIDGALTVGRILSEVNAGPKRGGASS